MRKKQYYIPGMDDLRQLVETPASKENTDTRRFVITTVLAAVAAVASVVAATASVIACFL